MSENDNKIPQIITTMTGPKDNTLNTLFVFCVTEYVDSLKTNNKRLENETSFSQKNAFGLG